jgi:succinate dehydrogenase / fumarate reductase iron-sulfur subunit
MATGKNINIKLKIWRQKNANDKGKIVDYKLDNVSTDSSFLEMLDQLNEELINGKQEPVAFDHDCREGICGMCSLYINGRCTCESLMMGTRFILNHGEAKHFQ